MSTDTSRDATRYYVLTISNERLQRFAKAAASLPHSGHWKRAVDDLADIEINRYNDKYARTLKASDPFCPKCGHNRDRSSVSTIEVGEQISMCQMCGTPWKEIA